MRSPRRAPPLFAALSFLPALLVAAVVAFGALAGCQHEPTPQLIEALDLVPREVERGDRVEVLGASFPPGKKAHVTFRGELHRPGEKPASAEIAADGTAATGTQIEIDFTEGLEQLFCGAGESSVHTTFTGDVEVAFPAATVGAPPVVATLHGATLDARPASPRRALLDARTKEGEGALAFLGIHPSKTPFPAGGIVIDAIDPGSRAEKATLQVGDLLVRFEGVQIASAADVIPRGGTKTATFTVRRGSAATEVKHEIAVDGFRASPPADLYGAGFLLLFAAAVLLLFLAPTVGALTWLERRVAARMKGRAPGGFAMLLEDDALSVSAGGPASPGVSRLLRMTPYLVFVGVSAGLVVMPFGQSLIAADLDVGILYVLAVTSLVALGLLAGGWGAGGRYSLLGGIRSAAETVSYEVPGAIAVACIVLMTGSLRLQEIIHAQGGWPWEWYVFKSPVTFALFFLYFTAALAGGSRPGLDLAEAAGARPVRVAGTDSASEGKRGARQLLLFFAFFAERANVAFMSGIAAALFLGGWQVPGLSAGAQEAHLGLQAVGAAVFLAKAWALLFAVVWARWTLPQLSVAQRMGLCWKWLVPLSFAAFALSAGWVVWGPGRGAQLVMGVAMFTVFCVGLARFAHRVRFNLQAAEAGAAAGAGAGQGDVRLNPFL